MTESRRRPVSCKSLTMSALSCRPYTYSQFSDIKKEMLLCDKNVVQMHGTKLESIGAARNVNRICTLIGYFLAFSKLASLALKTSKKATSLPRGRL